MAKLSKNLILELFEELNLKLKENHLRGEVIILGGAAMCLLYNSRATTGDVDAVFEPSSKIRLFSAEIANERGLPVEWLNSGIEAFLRGVPPSSDYLQLSHLSLRVAEPAFLLAMKCKAGRMGSYDFADCLVLVNKLGITDQDGLMALFRTYYPTHKPSQETDLFMKTLLMRMPAMG